jgi:hypothetical protein
MNDFEKTLVALFLIERSKELEVEMQRFWPMIDIGNGKKAATEFVLRCEKGKGQIIHPVFWVSKMVVERLEGNMAELLPAAAEYWDARGGLPREFDPTAF